MDIEQIRKFLDLRDEISALEKKVKALKAERDAVSEDILGQLVQEGVQSVNVDNNTVYVHTTCYASASGPEAAAVASEEGLAALCGVQPSKLRALVNEMGVEAFQTMYPKLKGFVKVEERSSVRARRA